MTTEEAAAFLTIDAIGPEDMPAVALTWLEQGYDFPVVAELASRSSRDHPRDLRDLLAQSLRELGATPPSKARAAVCIKRYCAQKVVDGALSPEAGAFHIIYDAYLGSGLNTPPGGIFGAEFGIRQVVGASCLDTIEASERRELEEACRKNPS